MARQEYWASGEKHTLEVIGNIHENPELLEASE
ncbi:YopX family protein [Latilactobacillus sakei]|nr:YopX family protein [Latilactobacillus sakei]